jgi:restriction system protein
MVELDEWARQPYEKSGYIRWESILHFFSIDCVKAGFLLKKKGVWYLTPEGEEALKLGEGRLLDNATEAYRKWRLEHPRDVAPIQAVEGEGPEVGAKAEQQELAKLEQIEQTALDGLKRQIGAKNPYDFQELAAALLRGMGYYTPFVAPKGKDGGIDIVAYRDPLGTESPRIKVQVKHREKTPAAVTEVRQLMGLLQKSGDVGMVVSSGGFTADAKLTARDAHVHVELIDLERFIELWQQFYPRLTDEDKQLLPLRAILFSAPPESA